MLRNLEGYKGSTRNFVAPVSESKFGGDFLQFTDTSGSNVPFKLPNKRRFAKHNTDVLCLEDGLRRFSPTPDILGLSDFTAYSDYFEYDFGFADISNILEIDVMVNGVRQNQSPKGLNSDFEADFYLVDNYRKLRILKNYGQNGERFGITLNSSDNIRVEYQLGVI